MSRKITRKDCYGCYNEIYHTGEIRNTKKCWSFNDATMSKGRLQHRDTLPKNYRGVWKLIPNCYIHQCGFVERKPKGETNG